jgi:hypothetical protein
MTLWNVWSRELHMKVPQVHDVLKCFANLRNVLKNKYVIIQYNIELVSSRSCTLMYHLDC